MSLTNGLGARRFIRAVVTLNGFYLEVVEYTVILRFRIYFINYLACL